MAFQAHRTPRRTHMGLRVLILLANLVLIAAAVHASRPAAVEDMERARELFTAGKYQDTSTTR